MNRRHSMAYAVGINVLTETQDIVTISPELAAEWLDRHGNRKNRKINANKVFSSYDLMRANRWIVSGELAICFNRSGMLLNGHHRLRAVIKLGRPVQFVVRRNVDDSVLKYIDSVPGRTRKQIARMLGEDTRFDAALSLIVQRKCGVVRSVGTVELEEMRANYSLVTQLISSQRQIRIGGKRQLRAGATAGLILIVRMNDEGGIKFMNAVAAIAFREATEPKAAWNLVRWLENKSGTSSQDAQFGSIGAVVNAFEQFMGFSSKVYVKGVSFESDDSVLNTYLNK